MVQVLGYLHSELQKLSIPCEFLEWTGPLSYPYFVSEITEFEPENESGEEEKAFVLTGFTRRSWIGLINMAGRLREAFPPVEGRKAILEDGSGIAVFYGSSLPIPTGEAELKKLQITLKIKVWKVE